MLQIYILRVTHRVELLSANPEEDDDDEDEEENKTANFLNQLLKFWK